jgi:hypothetical protein
MEKPKSVRLAVNLLWASLILGTAKAMWTGIKTSSHVSPAMIAIVLIANFAFLALLVLKMSDGRNWARMTFAIMYGLGVPIGIVWGFLTHHPLPISWFIQAAIQGYAIYLVFAQPGNTWFQKRS